jgi:hypothetical protein
MPCLNFSQVQRIKNDFTVAVYEIHARMALEVASERLHLVLLLADIPISKADMVEYNQCQSSLKGLYELGIPGNVEEFTAYRILLLLHGRNRSGSSLSLVLLYTLRLLTGYHP